MAYLWRCVFDSDAIPSVDAVTADLGERYRAYIFQAHAGLIREVHTALFLSAFRSVTKNDFEDYHHGVDLRFCGKPLAIRHAGSFSDAVWRQRKAEKSEGCIVLSARGHGSGIHLVSLADLRAKVLNG